MTKAPKVLGTLSIVFGALIAAWSPLSLFMRSFMKSMTSLVSAMPRQPGMRDPTIDMGAAQAIVEAQGSYVIVSSLVMLVMSVALIVIGIGLVKRRAWARRAAIAWSVVGLLILAAQCTAFFVHYQPLSEQVRDAYYRAHDVPPPPNVSSGASAVGAVTGWLIYASFPIVLLAMLGKRAAAAAFRA
jgi:hypothetical protein